MADTKASALTAVTTLASSDVAYVAAGGTLSRKITIPNFFKGFGHNVLHYGAVGDGSTDDTTAINAAITAAIAAGGTPRVIFPGNRTYCISTTLSLTWGIEFIGVGQRNVIPSEIPPTLKWIGAAGGTMVQVDTANAGFSTYFENMGFYGNAVGSNPAATAVKFISSTNNKIDSGTGFKNVWFNNFNGNAIYVNTAFGATNFFLEGGRFDAIYGGYGIYVNLTSGGSFVGSIWGNTNYVGGGSVQGKGFIHLDGEGASGGGAHLIISGLHTEINQDLVETFASGTNPYDKQGVIRCGVNPSGTSTQYTFVINGWANSSAGVKSYSAIQITSTTGTDAECASSLNVTINGGGTLSMSESGSGDAGTTNEVRLFGGRVPSRMRHPIPANYRHGSITWGEGRDFTGEFVASFHYARHGAELHRGFALKQETVADLVTPKFGAGAQAFVTDASTNTRHSVVSSGGAYAVPVFYNGSNWLIS